MEAIQIQLTDDKFKPSPGWSIYYRAHVQSKGWMPWMFNGAIAGTTGQGLRLEALRIGIGRLV